MPLPTPESDCMLAVPGVAMDVIFQTDEKFRQDPFHDKVNLGIGAYRDAQGRPYLLPVVKEVEDEYEAALGTGKENKEYDTNDGFRPFCEASVRMLLGDELMPPSENLVAVVTLSGTGAVRVASELLSQTNPSDAPKDVLVSAETWPAHRTIFEGQGFKVIPHRYFDPNTRAIDFDGMKADLRAAAERSVLILHLCGHNPTGCDPSQEQWRELCEIAREKRFRVIFDSAYQGYASGSLERDAYAARYFATQGVQFMTCQSYAKNMGMYGDRLGCFSLTCSSPAVAKNVTSYLKARVLRPLWSNPPRRPSRVAYRILSDPALYARWQGELTAMAGRIQHIRKVVHDELIARSTPGTWRHIVDQIGMFSYTGLTEAQCVRLQKDFHIYMLPTGRASLAGLQDHTAIRFARAVDYVVRDLPTPEDVVNMV